MGLHGDVTSGRIREETTAIYITLSSSVQVQGTETSEAAAMQAATQPKIDQHIHTHTQTNRQLRGLTDAVEGNTHKQGEH